MERIKNSDLDYLVSRINEATNSPTTYCDTKHPTPFKSNIGHYHLDSAYGGVKLVRVANEGGGISDISRDGYGTKRELYKWMRAFLAGLAVKSN